MIYTYFMKANNHKQHNSQRQILDHHFANNIFFTALSTLQSLKSAVQNQHKESYKNKLFANYDRVDYSGKDTLELQSQLQTHLLILKASIKTYYNEYTKQWSPPSNFNRQQSQKFIKETLDIFKRNGDKCSEQLADDFIKILNRCVYIKLYIDTVQIKGKYNQQQQLEHQNSLFQNGTKAQNAMDVQQQKILNNNVNSIMQLQANLNICKDEQVEKIYWVLSNNSYMNIKDNKEEFAKYHKSGVGSAFESLDQAQRFSKKHYPERCIVEILLKKRTREMIQFYQIK